MCILRLIMCACVLICLCLHVDYMCTECVCVCRLCVQCVCSGLPRTPYGVRGDKYALGAALSRCLWTHSSAH